MENRDLHQRLDLLDFRREVFQMYARVRAGGVGAAPWEQFCRDRDRLFRGHPQSALSEDQKNRFRGLRYYPYDPDLRFEPPLDPDSRGGTLEFHLRDDGPLRMGRLGRVRLRIEGREVVLTVFQIMAYGGGLFLPFRDATNADKTYEGGRYLLDTIKGADLGQVGASLILDFNYAYNPSCAYNPRWDCPLPPPENWVSVPVRAGEMRYRE